MDKSRWMVWGSIAVVVVVAAGCGTSAGSVDAAATANPDARSNDAAVAMPDAPIGAPDSAVTTPDAPVGAPDAPVTAPDAFVGAPDAAITLPDAFVGAPDAHPVDAIPPSPDARPAIDASCSPPTTYGGNETSMAGATVTAKILDESGAPVAGQPTYICGLDICSNPGMTQADGSLSLHSNLTEKKPAFKVGDGIDYAELAIPLTMATTDFSTINTAKLSGKPGAALTPGSDAVSGDVTLSIPAGAVIGIDSLVYDTADKQKLRAVSIPMANEGPVLASSGVSGFGLLYGLAPAESTACPPLKMTVALPHATMSPNDLGWAPGSAVEFWVMTTDTAQTFAPYAGWAKMSDGVVSGDGRSVATLDGQGFNFLETFAIRKAP